MYAYCNSFDCQDLYLHNLTSDFALRPASQHFGGHQADGARRSGQWRWQGCLISIARALVESKEMVWEHPSWRTCSFLFSPLELKSLCYHQTLQNYSRPNKCSPHSLVNEMPLNISWIHSGRMAQLWELDSTSNCWKHLETMTFEYVVLKSNSLRKTTTIYY